MVAGLHEGRELGLQKGYEIGEASDHDLATVLP